MTEKFCVLLRGINVNGIKIKMDDLKEAFDEMGFPNVKTILATGNVIISVSEADCEHQKLKLLFEKGLSERFNYDAHVILRSEKEIEGIHSAVQTMVVPEGYHNYFIFCDDEKLIAELDQLFHSLANTLQEQFLTFKYGAFWVVPKGSTLDSGFGSKVLGDKKYKNRLTSRNISTVEKIYSCMLG